MSRLGIPSANKTCFDLLISDQDQSLPFESKTSSLHLICTQSVLHLRIQLHNAKSHQKMTPMNGFPTGCWSDDQDTD